MDHTTVKQWMFAICIENPVIQRKGEFKCTGSAVHPGGMFLEKG